MSRTALSAEGIERQILTLRGHRVMLDAHLAVLYGVDTRTLNQAVRRNLDRFPEDFMFQLTWEEAAALRSQSVILNPPADSGSGSQSVTLKRGTHLKYRPSAFTEQGVAMLSSVLRSKQAVQVNIEVMQGERDFPSSPARPPRDDASERTEESLTFHALAPKRPEFPVAPYALAAYGYSNGLCRACDECAS